MLHPRAAARFHERLRHFADRRSDGDPGKASRAHEHLDWWLDQYGDSLFRATEWDADQWGFDPDRWMEAERRELAERGGADRPKEMIL